MKVIIREAAYDDLDRIYAWIAKDAPRAADTVAETILASARYLGRFPHIGHSGAVAGTYEWIVPRFRYIVVYRIFPQEKIVSVEAIFHVAQDR
jgi:plasmid stabilization system protein ParE